jgi:CDP-4-dehydro-6-deoxyglucose reductase
MKVTIQSSQKTFTVNPEQGVLDAALHQGINMPYGCRSGKCGDCMGQLIEGRVHYPNGQPDALSDEDLAQGKAIFCQAHADSDLVIEVRTVNTAEGIIPRKMPARVAELNHLAHDVVQLKLKVPAAERMQFLAGQYVDFILKDGRRRAFSLANPPHDDEFLEFHIRHVPGGFFTSYVFDEMKEKALIRIEGPLGSFFLREDSDAPIIMVAGGTGFAPMQGMLLHANEIGLKRPIHLFWGVRAKRDLYLDEEVRSWAEQYDHIQYTPVLSEPAREDNWQGETGWVHDAVVRAYPDLSAYEVYMSGPPPMIDAAKQAFLARGLAENHLFSDSFEFADDPNLSATEKEIA